LNAADPSCNLDWTLIAAIGRVESDHGRFGGNALDAEGKARPGIYGIALNGFNGTARITDTDGGRYDNDPIYDRAVGPMQFIPGTWEVAGVDADQDGVKDPQDIDDAATAAGVYLCAGAGDLSTDSGQRAAVYRYNHSSSYVDTVLSIAAAYAGGDFAPVPNGTASATTLTPTDPQAQAGKAEAQGRAGKPRDGGTQGDSGTTSGPRPERSPDSEPRREPDNEPRDEPKEPEPRQEPSPRPTASAQPEKTVDKAKKTVKETVDTLGLGEATAMCEDKLGGTVLGDPLVGECGEVLQGKAPAKAKDLLAGSVTDVLARLGLA
ncbi:MAG: hypothetical protein ACRDQF_19590, partial [Thermocrispum sp.]